MNGDNSKDLHDTQERIRMPSPTAWPIALAFGLTLLFAGLVTAASVSILGIIVAVVSAVGWFREVLPVESHEWVPVAQQDIAIQTSRKTVERIAGVGEVPRAWLPVETYPISAGLKGGLAGGAVMALLAAAYGLFSGNGIWYPMNLLVAGFFPRMATETTRQIGTFSFLQFQVAVAVHLVISVVVGLLYGAMLPMLPRRPVLLGGFIAPLLWSGMMYGILEFVNPVMNQRIDWWWFVLSQIGFGLTAGLVVTAQQRIRTNQNLPLMIRLGIEAPGLVREHQEDLHR